MAYVIPSVLELAQALISCPSETPHDAGCQDILSQYLKSAGFEITRLRFENVENLWAKHGQSEPLFVWLGHTDVVPSGPLEEWHSGPFEPNIRNGHLYGRGACDMKGAVAAMVCATLQFVQDHPKHIGSIAFLITSDEEGIAINGTKKVVEHLMQQKEKPNWCVVGEPSSKKTVGDVIKVGRRGSLSAVLKIFGKQGHIAYPQLAENPIHKSFAALTELINTEWDQGNDRFPPTSFQISNIHAGTGAGNVIPGCIDVQFNFRYSPEVDAEGLKQRTQHILDKYSLHYDIQWDHSGLPFQTPSGKLLQAVQTAINNVTGLQPELSTDGGTSDGRFIAPTGCEVIELGLSNKTIHQVNENISISDLNQLTKMYYRVLELLLT